MHTIYIFLYGYDGHIIFSLLDLKNVGLLPSWYRYTWYALFIRYFNQSRRYIMLYQSVMYLTQYIIIYSIEQFLHKSKNIHTLRSI